MNQVIKQLIIFISLFLVFFPHTVSSQSDSIAIFESMIPDAKSDHEFYNIYFSLADKLFTSEPKRGIDYAYKALEYAGKTNQDDFLVGANIVLAQNLTYAGYPDSALPYARKAYSITRQGKTGKYAFSAINTLGNVFDENLISDSTLFYYNLALDFALKDGNQFNMAAAYNNLGLVYSDAGDVQKAYEYYLKAAKMFEATNNLKSKAITLNNIATINQRNNEYEKSIEYLMQAIDLNSEMGEFYHLSMNYSNLGIAYKELKLYDSALICYQKSQELNEKHGFDSDYARHYYNLGNLYYEKDDLVNARINLDRSTEISEKQGVKLGVLFNNMRLFDIDIKENRFAQARKRLRIIEDVINETNRVSYIDELILRKSTYYEKVGDFRTALEVFKDYHDHLDSIRELDYKKNVAELQEKYESEKKSRENQTLRDEVLLQEKTIQYQYLLVILFAVVLVFVIVIAIILFNSRTKLTRANKELTSLNKKVNVQKTNLVEANATKDKMFSIIAHDLRSPFNTLLGFLELLVSEYDDLDDKEKKSLLNTLNLQSKKTYGLLENLLQWSMMQRGLVKLYIDNYNLHQIVKHQISDLSQRAEAKNVELVNLVDSSMEIEADEVMIKTILRNLINNSIKFSNAGKQIKIWAEKKTNSFELCVEDKGIGMTQEYANKLFTKQIPDSTPGTGNERGSGLGLRIVKDFVDMMNGEIRVETRPGEGATFCVIINNQ